MSRSYHVTERKVRRAWAEGDKAPMYAASEKSWVKKKQKEERALSTVRARTRSNRAIVGREKARTREVLQPRPHSK
jgi:hypothetical protein